MPPQRRLACVACGVFGVLITTFLAVLLIAPSPALAGSRTWVAKSPLPVPGYKQDDCSKTDFTPKNSWPTCGWGRDQIDPKSHSSGTISDYGCLLTALDEVLLYWQRIGVVWAPAGVNLRNPHTLSKSLANEGLIDSSGNTDARSSAFFNVIRKWFELVPGQSKWHSITSQQMALYLQRGIPVIIEVSDDVRPYTHFLVVTGRNKTGFLGNDPGGDASFIGKPSNQPLSRGAPGLEGSMNYHLSTYASRPDLFFGLALRPSQILWITDVTTGGRSLRMLAPGGFLSLFESTGGNGSTTVTKATPMSSWPNPTIRDVAQEGLPTIQSSPVSQTPTYTEPSVRFSGVSDMAGCSGDPTSAPVPSISWTITRGNDPGYSGWAQSWDDIAQNSQYPANDMSGCYALIGPPDGGHQAVVTFWVNGQRQAHWSTGVTLSPENASTGGQTGTNGVGASATESVAHAPTITSVQVSAAPQITGVSPNPVPGSNSLQWVTVNGSGFDNGAQVRWTASSPSPASSGTVSSGHTQWVSAGEIRVDVDVTTAASPWTFQVVNPDQPSSNTFDFSVSAPAPAPGPASSPTPTQTASPASVPAPTITSVQVSAGGQVEITGQGFGTEPQFAPPGDSAVLAVFDATGKWQEGHAGNSVGVGVETWTNTSIVLTAGTGYGSGGHVFNPGDTVEVSLGGASGTGTVPAASYTEPSVSFSTTASQQCASPAGTVTGPAVTWTINPGNDPAYTGWGQNWDSAQATQQFGPGSTSGCLGEAGLSPGSHTAEVTIWLNNQQWKSFPSSAITTAPPAAPGNVQYWINPSGTIYEVVDGAAFALPDVATAQAVCGCVNTPNVPQSSGQISAALGRSLPSGELVQAPAVLSDGYATASGVFVAYGGSLYPIPSPAVLSALGYNSQEVRAIPWQWLNSLPKQALATAP